MRMVYTYCVPLQIGIFIVPVVVNHMLDLKS